LIKLREQIQNDKSDHKKDVVLTYITSRGTWYLISWKGHTDRSGGMATNIGIHFFDLLIWLFGPVQNSEVHACDTLKTGGYLELENARVRWYLSIDRNDLPEEFQKKGQPTFRSITIDDEEMEFSGGFENLHTEVYSQILKGNGFGLTDAMPSITLAHDIRVASPVGRNDNSHDLLK